MKLANWIKTKVSSMTQVVGLSQAIWMFLGYVAKIGFQSVSFFFLATVLGPRGFGLFSSVMALVNLIAPYVELGTYSLAVRDVSQGQSVRESLGASLCTMLITLPVGLLILYGLVWTTVPEAGSAMVLALGVGAFVGGRLISNVMGVHTASGLIQRNALVEAIYGFLMFVLVLLLKAVNGGVTVWAIFYLTLTLLVGLAGLAWIIQGWGTPVITPDAIRSRFVPGLHFAVAQSAQTAQGELDKAILTRLTSLEIVGVYSIAHRIVTLGFLPIASLLGALYPRFFQVGKDGLPATRQVVRKVLPITVGCGVLVAAVMWVGAPVISLILGSEYGAVPSAIRILSVGLVFQALYMPVADALTGSGFQAVRMKIQLGVTGVAAVVNLLLVPVVGWIGAAWTNVGSQVLLTLMIVLAFRKGYTEQVHQ